MSDADKKPTRATITDIARAAGVSISTVSRVLNGNVPVAVETAERVWAAVKRLDYIPNSAAQMLASRRTNNIGLLLPNISGIFFTPMLRGIERCVNQHGFDLLVYSSSNSSTADGAAHKKPLGEHNTDGLLVFTDSLSEQDLGAFHRRGFPMVLLHRTSPPGMAIPSVIFENQHSVEQLIDHLIEVHGCRRIAFLRGPQANEDAALRETGYRAALARHGLAVDPELIEQGNYDTIEATWAMRRLLDKGVPFDAVFAGDDDSAAGVFLAMNERSLHVPDDIRVVGFDDSSIAQLLAAPLTTVHAPIEEAGFEAARQLIQLIQTGQADPQVVLPTHLVIRRSCGCPPATILS